MQQSRFELKYHLREETALRIRDYIQNFLRFRISLDEYSVGKPNFSYPVHSLYLDSDDLLTYWTTINGDKNRFKLRIRYYDAKPGSPMFFEIKRRMNHCILKQRGGVRMESVPWLLEGHDPSRDDLLVKDEKQLAPLRRFCQLMQEIHGRPKVHIAYLREAYVTEDDAFRVTLDREVCAAPNLDGVIQTKMENRFECFPGKVILELKFTNRFPNWYRELVQCFNLMQCGAAKYADGVQGIGHRALGSRFPAVEDHPPHLRPPGAPDYPRPRLRREPIPEWVSEMETN